jgi:hypothetical protein
MNMLSLAKRSANYVYENMTKNPGNMLLLTGTFGWILSSLAQVTAVVINKKIPKEQKKFLIPQEMADAAVNIASFFIITKAFTRLGEGLVQSGKLLTPKIRGHLAKYKLDSFVGQKITENNLKNMPEILKGQKTGDMFNISKLSMITDRSDKANFKTEFSNDYFDFSDGMSFISSMVGSIISCNIVTPILRNKFAANRQKHAITQDKMQNKDLLPVSPVLPAQNRFGIDDYKSKVIASSKINGGAMKI